MNTTFINSFYTDHKYGNFILDLHPWVKLNICFGIALLAGIWGHIWLRLAAIVSFYIIAYLATKLKDFHKSFVAVSLLLFFLLFILRAIFFPGQQIIFELGIIQISVESIISGLSFALLVVEICGAVILYYSLTPMKDIMYSIERLGASSEVSYIFMAAMQQISDLRKSAQTILESQSARGIETEGNLFVRFKAFIPILGPVILSSIAATEEKTITMETRAFYAPAVNTHVYQIAPLTHKQKSFCILLNVFLLSAIIARILL